MKNIKNCKGCKFEYNKDKEEEVYICNYCKFNPNKEELNEKTND